MADDIITRDDNGDLAVNVVTSTEGNVPYNYDDCFTLDTNGRRALRVVGAGGGGDSHNKGYFATQSALEEAYPTGEAGDYAIVGSTDTVWIWDEDSSEWIDSDQKGQVTSVNGQTGAVTVSEVPSQTGYSGRVLGTDGFVAGWVVPEKVQRSTMPQASEEEVNNIYQYVGTTDANYTNGYFYKCVSDGQDPATYSWSQVSVQPAPSGLPDQTGQSGKFLTTDGTDASWSDKPLVNETTGQNAVSILGTNRPTATNMVAIGKFSGGNAASFTVLIGYSATSRSRYGIAIGNGAAVGLSADYAIQLGASGTNSDANTFKVANENGNFEMMSADGTIPEARLADTTNAAQGQVLTLDSNLNAVWQASSGGGLPSQSGNAGKFLTTDGTDASWANALTNKATGNEALAVEGLASGTRSVAVSGVAYCGETVVIGVYATAYNNVGAKNNVLIGKDAQMMRAAYCIAIGWGARVSSSAATLTEHAIQLGSTGSYTYNDDSNTLKVANANGNFMMMDANGNLPADRLASTTGLADGNYRLRCTITNGVPTLSWVAE